jgi:hypothetical protein
MALTWSILIVSHVTRAELLNRLIGLLAPQVTEDIEVVVLRNRGGRDIGEYRQALVADARGIYVSHVDDDDRIPDHYCKSILGALETGPDYVGFKVAVNDLSQRRLDEKYQTYVADHSLAYDRWHQQGNRFYRDVTHLNPIRRRLALQAVFSGAYAEDKEWADQVRPHVQSQVYIDDILYYYDFAHDRSVRSGESSSEPMQFLKLPARFRFHPDSEV